MKPAVTVLAAVLAAAPLPQALSAAQEKPLAHELYVRGAFNGWGTDNLLVYRGKGIYEADVLVSPGNHAFKIGSKDWRVEWVADPAASVRVGLDRAYPLANQAGPEDYLFTRHTATLRFRVDASDAARPQLTVTQLALPPAGPAADPHRDAAAVRTLDFATWDGKQEQARFSSPDPDAPLRSYVHSTTLQLRDPGPQFTTYREDAALPRVRSGNLAFDALFALALHEMRQDAVSIIRDGNYQGNAPIPCDCFETGEKWHYVWTRDLSYAADLGLAMLDPQRVRNSLEFKLSGWRDGVPQAAPVAAHAAHSPDGLQIVQDTGSGGSWPVSTDRVVWAFAAAQTLDNLAPAERPAFAAKALQALANTIENDRLAAFDRSTGLYTGEASFLDWRDQSYAAWITGDLASMASSAALSTNVAHYQALRLAAQLAREQGDRARAARYGGWAAALKRAINTRLWLPDEGMYSSLTAAHFDGAPLHKFDWLGQALAIVTGIADAAQTRSILSRYPHGPLGAPVIWPQQQGMPVYHNRAMWPFVTAYGLRAAALGGHAGVADAAYDALIRGAALNLSNMENLEWLSGQPVLLDEQHPELIGPVIDSRRQLWSVGGYIGMVVRNVFGVSTTAAGIRVQPFVTPKLRAGMIGADGVATLRNLRLRGHAIDVVLRLPADAGAGSGHGAYAVERILLNGEPAGADIRWDRLKDRNTLEIRFGKAAPDAQPMRRVQADPYREDPAVFGPREPVIGSLARDGAGHATLAVGGPAEQAGVTYNIYRDGKPVARGLAAGSWTDRHAPAGACYAAEAQFAAGAGSGANRSHHSRPRCLGAEVHIAATDARIAANVALAGPDARFAEAHLANWGKPDDRFAVGGVRVPETGVYAVQVRYHNGANQINLGISAGVKWLAVKNGAGAIVAQGVVQLPHARIDRANTPAVLSTPLTARLDARLGYRIEMSDFFNMSYLQSNSSFGGAGGVEGPSNRFDIYGVRLLRLR